MLHLTINNFLCYNNLTLNIPMGTIVLLKGPSGSGKTTILKSIAWVLYGNIKKITPRKNPNSKTSANIIINNINITRSTNPKKITFIYNENTYEDQDAQDKINKLFGEYDIWLSTSYIMQKKDNNFLSASNASKMEMLNMLVFHNDIPTEYINKIDKA